jgi:hypothetical protein
MLWIAEEGLVAGAERMEDLYIKAVRTAETYCRTFPESSSDFIQQLGPRKQMSSQDVYHLILLINDYKWRSNLIMKTILSESMPWKK